MTNTWVRLNMFARLIKSGRHIEFFYHNKRIKVELTSKLTLALEELLKPESTFLVDDKFSRNEMAVFKILLKNKILLEVDDCVEDVSNIHELLNKRLMLEANDPNTRKNLLESLKGKNRDVVKELGEFEYLRNRRTTRFKNLEELDLKSLTEKDILKIFNMIYGNTFLRNDIPHKTVSSAGAMYPIKIYYINFSDKKIYMYNGVNKLQLCRKVSEARLKTINKIIYETDSQKWNGLVIFAMDLEFSIKKYKYKSYYFSLIEMGEVLQNLNHYCARHAVPLFTVGSLDNEFFTKMIGKNKNTFYGISCLI